MQLRSLSPGPASGRQPASRRPRALVSSGTSRRPEPSLVARLRAVATSSRAVGRLRPRGRCGRPRRSTRTRRRGGSRRSSEAWPSLGSREAGGQLGEEEGGAAGGVAGRPPSAPPSRAVGCSVATASLAPLRRIALRMRRSRIGLLWRGSVPTTRIASASSMSRTLAESSGWSRRTWVSRDGAARGARVDVRRAERLAHDPLDQVALLVGGVADDRGALPRRPPSAPPAALAIASSQLASTPPRRRGPRTRCSALNISKP